MGDIDILNFQTGVTVFPPLAIAWVLHYPAQCWFGADMFTVCFNSVSQPWIVQAFSVTHVCVHMRDSQCKAPASVLEKQAVRWGWQVRSVSPEHTLLSNQGCGYRPGGVPAIWMGPHKWGTGRRILEGKRISEQINTTQWAVVICLRLWRELM